MGGEIKHCHNREGNGAPSRVFRCLDGDAECDAGCIQLKVLLDGRNCGQYHKINLHLLEVRKTYPTLLTDLKKSKMVWHRQTAKGLKSQTVLRTGGTTNNDTLEERKASELKAEMVADGIIGANDLYFCKDPFESVNDMMANSMVFGGVLMISLVMLPKWLMSLALMPMLVCSLWLDSLSQ